MGREGGRQGGREGAACRPTEGAGERQKSFECIYRVVNQVSVLQYPQDTYLLNN